MLGTGLRRGVTVVELLVAIFIVGILTSLAVVATGGARERARQVQCANYLRNLALAAVEHEVVHGRYPGYLQKFGRWDPGLPLLDAASLPAADTTRPSLPTLDPADPLNTAALPHEKLGTWAVALLPYLEEQPTYEFWTDDRYPLISNHLPTLDNYNASAVPNFAIFQCPSDPNDDGGHGRNSYVSNNGYVDPTGGLLPRDFARSMKRANGIFNNKYAGPNLQNRAAATPVGPDVRSEHIRDGLSTTLLFSESLQAQPWYRVGWKLAPTQALVAPALHLNASHARGYQGMVWRRYDDRGMASSPLPPRAAAINGLLDTTDPEPLFSFDLARPSSEHPGGVNAAFADGSVRFLNDTIEYRAYQALLTPHGKSSDVPFKEYVLKSESL